MALLAYALRLGLVALHVPAAPRLVIVGVVGAVSYLLLVRWRAPDLLEQITRMLLPGIGALRGAVTSSRANGAPRGSLTPALHRLARRSRLTVQLDGPPLTKLPDEIEVLAYRVASETLENVAAHTRGARVRILVEQSEDELRLAIRCEDFGGTVLPPGTGLGRLRAPVRRLGGTLALASSGEETLVSLNLPLP
jgi:signal transduction histidine kinase